MPRTTHTPTGDYPHPASVHDLDLTAIADKLTARLPGNRRQSENIARESGVSIVMVAMESGDAIQEHAADGVVSVQVLRGHAILSTPTETVDARPGQLVLFQPGVRHDLRAEEQSVVLLTVTGGEAGV